jgi:DNA-binding NtrC family response regulator
MNQARILVVDDHDSIRHFLARALEDEGYEVTAVASARAALEAAGRDLPDLVILDLRLPDVNGLSALERLKALDSALPVIILTAFGEVESAVRAMKLGACDYLNKPVNLEQLSVAVSKALESQRTRRELQHLRKRDGERYALDFVRGESPAIQSVYAVAEQVARSGTTTVLIEGESGTGKELVANLIHRASPRRDGPFLEINCAAIPKDLLESELFGHERGAFTDARSAKQGLLELADGGTLFLDEVGEMNLTLQAKLLKVLEKMTFKRVGGTKDITVSVRVVSATNQDLTQAVAAGLFREDLYYRLKVVPIRLPALRERGPDILHLARHFLLTFAQAFNKQFRALTPEAEEALLSYPWPGNIRELKNLMERVVLLESGEVLDASMLRLPATAPMSPTALAQDDAVARIAQILGSPRLPDSGVSAEEILDELERRLILKASEQTGWNQTRTAALLGMRRDRLRYRMKLFGLGCRADGSDQAA